MNNKIITIHIPKDKFLLPEIKEFSLEENYLMLKIGSECLLEGRKAVTGLTQKEICEKIAEDYKGEIEKMHLDLRIEKELTKKMEERLTKIYETQIEQLKKQLESMNQQLLIYETENKDKIFKEVDKYREKYDLLLLEKDKQNNLNREVFDKAEKLLNKNKNKSSKGKGDEGEEQFGYLSETFKDFNGYRCEDKSKQGHKGDFHLFFDEFNVLVDLKNYSDSVQKKEIEKIEMDLMTNDNMDYAWLISLDSDISGWNRFPIMNKWIMTDNGMKCIIFINNLLESKEPKNTLRLTWSICNEFNKLITGVDKDEEELKMYKERDFILNKKIKNLQERVSEMKRNINISLNIVKNMDSDLIEALSFVSNEIIMDECEKYQKIKEWFSNNVEFCMDEEVVLKSTDIWNRFKKENKELIAEKNITIDSFKEFLIKMVDSSNYIEKSKKGAIELIGFKLKEVEQENILNKGCKTKALMEKNIFYFNEKMDKIILDEYNDSDKNIMMISYNNNIRPWEVVSLLMKHKVIAKRVEARGYDIYKETDEYKDKISK